MNKSTKPAAAPAEADQVAQFESSLNELEALVARMEEGELSLDESLQSFERGIKLYRDCQGALEQAELRVRLLGDPEHPESDEDFPATQTNVPAKPARASSDDSDSGDDLPF